MIRITSVILIVLGALAAAVPASAQQVVLRYAFADVSPGNRPYSGSGPSAIANALGMLQDEFKNDPNVKLEISFMRGGPVINEAVVNKQLDMFQQGDLPAIVGRSNGLKTKILMGTDSRQNTYLAVTPKSGLTDVKKFGDHKVALFRGTNVQLATNEYLRSKGLTERDLKIVPMNFYDSFAALTAGDVDASFGEADLKLLEDKGITKVIWDSKKEPEYTRATLLLASDDFIKAHPEIVARVVKVFVKAAHWASDEGNREKVLEEFAKTGRGIDVFRAEYANQPMSLRMSPVIDNFLKKKIAQSAKTAKELSLIRTEISTDDWYDLHFVNDAIKQLGYDGYWKNYE
jgi:sulfonate transport system substrate-binding protein